jgi:hypothetical protein
VREFALRAPDQSAVAILRPLQVVCEGPVASPAETRGVGIFGGSVLGVAVLAIDVRDATTRMRLASGQIDATAPGEYVARLSRPVAAGRPLKVCVVDILNTFSLSGSAAVDPNVQVSGAAPGSEFSLVLDNSRSFLGSLSIAFSRASLWRASWVGSWTFWVLAFALLGTFALGVLAVMSADSADQGRDEPTGLQLGQDRAEPVH